MHASVLNTRRLSHGVRGLAAVLGALVLVAAMTPRVHAASYGGYTGDVSSGILVCDPGFSTVGLTEPDVTISSDKPDVFNEQQRVYTTSMLFQWVNGSWQSVSGWSPWQMAVVNDLDGGFTPWYEWDGSRWSLTSAGPIWDHLASGYYATVTWLWGTSHDGVAAGWARTSSYDSINPWCQV